MTGMKEGAGEDPFGDNSNVATEDASPATSDIDPVIEGGSETKDIADDGSSSTNDRQINIPYKFRRDSVQDNRDRVPLFMQADTKTAEREAMRELENRFDQNVSMTDLREALVKVGLEHLDETETTLEDWGYGLTFD